MKKSKIDQQIANVLVYQDKMLSEIHFPNEKAAEIAVKTVQEFLKKETSVKKVIFNVFKNLDLEIYKKLLTRA